MKGHGKSCPSFWTIGETWKSGFHLFGINIRDLAPLLLPQKPEIISLATSLTPPQYLHHFLNLIFYSDAEDEKRFIHEGNK